MFLTHVLQQVSGVYLRAKDDPSVLTAVHSDRYLVRVLSHDHDEPMWEDSPMPPEPPPKPVPAAPAHLDELRLARLANTAALPLHVSHGRQPLSSRAGRRSG